MTTPLNIKISDQTVLDDIDSCRIESNDTDFCKSATLEFKSNRFWVLCDPNYRQRIATRTPGGPSYEIPFFGKLRIDIIIGATTYQFLIEERDSNVQKTGVVFSVWGRSKQALLDKPYSKNILDTDTSGHPWQTGNNKVSTIISYILTNYCPYSVTVTWNVEDYIVYKDALSINNQSPKEIISALAEAIGAELVPHDDGSLSIESYSVAEEASVATYNDMDDIVQLSESIEHASGYNAVTVYGYGRRLDAYISTEVIVGTYVGREFDVKVYFYHPDGLQPLCSLPNGSSDLDPTVQTEDITEYVILIWGKGNTNKPNTDGETEVTGDEDIPFDHQSVTYTVQYMKYTLRADYYGDFVAFFYFSDKSTYAEYSFTVGVDPDAVEFSLAATLEWYSGEVVGTVTSVGAGEYVEVDLFTYYHWLSGVEIIEKGNSANASMTFVKSDIKEVTESITFTNGESSLTYPYHSNLSVDWLGPDYSPSAFSGPSVVEGSKKIVQTDLIGDTEHYFTAANVTYRTEYKRYKFLIPESYAVDTIKVWFELDKDIGMISISASVTAVLDLYKDITIIIRDYIDETLRENASVYIDDSYKGLTDSDGLLNVSDVRVGDHTIKVLADGYVDSDLDDLDNDAFTVSA